MNRLLTVVLSLMFVTSNTHAVVGTNGLQQAVDQFNYAVEVEWDQTDQGFYHN